MDDQVEATRWAYVQVRRWLDQVELQRIRDAVGVTGPGAVTSGASRSVTARSPRDRARSLGTWSDTLHLPGGHSNGRKVLALITGDQSQSVSG